MKFKIQLKDPDGVYNAVTDASAASADAISGITDHEREAIRETRREKIIEQCRKWIRHGEYVTIEIDTDNMTATVCEQ
jgi:heterodisulfide reductase subunit A-like polyferredoxin